MRKRSSLHATLVGACLVLGLVLTAVPLPLAEARDEPALLAQVQIDWAPLTQWFTVSNIHLGSHEVRTAGITTDHAYTFPAILFTVEANAAFHWYDIPQFIRFYDANGHALLGLTTLHLDPHDLVATGGKPGTRSQGAIPLSVVKLSQVHTIRFIREAEE
jgi:hypothetical protein